MKKNSTTAKLYIDSLLDKNGVVVLPPMDASESMRLMYLLGYHPQMTMLDPWYNRGTGGVREDYVPYILDIISNISDNTNHLFLWGFPEIVAQFINKIPPPLEFVCWLTWYYKNNPSVIRGWRFSQQACLHYAQKKAKMYPQNFFNPQQQLRFEESNMRFIPGPTSVIEEPLLVGFIGKKEQTGHPSQKPEKVYEKLVLMTSMENDLIYDPMAGGGTIGAACKTLRRKCIMSDMSDEYVKLIEKRLKIKRIPLKVVDDLLLEVA